MSTICGALVLCLLNFSKESVMPMFRKYNLNLVFDFINTLCDHTFIVLSFIFNGGVIYMTLSCVTKFVQKNVISITLPRYPQLFFRTVLNSCYVEVMVSTDAPTHNQYNVIRINSAYVTLTLSELPHCLGFMFTPKQYLS